MAAVDPPPLTVVRPGEGLSGHLGSIGVGFKLWATRRAARSRWWRIGGHTGRPAHAPASEYSIVTRGRDRVPVRRVLLGPGGYPRGELHAQAHVRTDFTTRKPSVADTAAASAVTGSVRPSPRQATNPSGRTSTAAPSESP